jgi:hypothetical protein
MAFSSAKILDTVWSSSSLESSSLGNSSAASVHSTPAITRLGTIPIPVLYMLPNVKRVI